MRNYFVTFLCSIALALPLSLNAAPAQKTHEFHLDNGLKVIVREDHRAPIVVSQLWYKVGSSYEVAGNTGLSHALEHMMFKGSSKLGPGESSRVLRELGAQENAFTSDDYTAYYQILARDRLEIALQMEADRMASATLPADEFVKEIEVIKEERRLRTEDNPSALAYERFKALAYLSSGYRNPVIGWMHDLERMTIEDLRQWYQQWYSPNNATLVIVGDVQLNEVKPLVERYFGPIPARPVPDAKKPLELAEPGERRAELYLKTELPSLTIGFNVPSLQTADNPKDVYALRLISAILDGGESSRFSSELVRQQESVVQAGAFYNAFARGDSLFVIAAVPNTQKNISLPQLEKTLWQQLKTLQTQPPTQAELDRVRAQVIAFEVYGQDSIANQANQIGALESVGLSWQLIDKDIEQLQQITPADIQAAAQTYFTLPRSVTLYRLPEEMRP